MTDRNGYGAGHRNGTGHSNTNGDEHGHEPVLRLPVRDRDRAPFNAEAEQGVIGSLWIEPECAHDVFLKLRPEDFFRAAHQILFRRMRELYESSAPFDIISTTDLLERRGELERVGIDYCQEIAVLVPHAHNVNYYADIVISYSHSRGVIDAAGKILADARSNQYPKDELQARAEQTILAAGERRNANALKLGGDNTAETMEILMQRQNGVRDGLPTGFDDLDLIVDGFKPGQLIVLAARPSMGKSALALNIADHVAVACGQPTLFISLEMSSLELGERHLSQRANVYAGVLRAIGHLTPREKEGVWTKLRQAQAEIANGALVIDDSPSLDITQLAATARRMKAQHGLGLLIVDYLQLISGPRLKGESRQEEVARISRRLKQLAKELNVPALILSQLNRESERREDRMPRLADLRESGQIEQDADIALLLHRPEIVDPTDQPGLATLTVAKNRNGRTGTVKLRFISGCTRFEPLNQAEDLPVF